MRGKSSVRSTGSKSRRWIVLVLMVLPLALAATPSSAHTVGFSHTPPTSVPEGKDLPLAITVNGDCERGGASAQFYMPRDWDYYANTIAGIGAKTECGAINLELTWRTILQDGSVSEAGYQSVQMGPADSLGARTATLTVPGADVVGSRLYYSVRASQAATGPCARVYHDNYPGALCQVAGITINRPPLGADKPDMCTSTASNSRDFSVRIDGVPAPSPSPSPSPTSRQGNGQGKGKK